MKEIVLWGVVILTDIRSLKIEKNFMCMHVLFFIPLWWWWWQNWNQAERNSRSYDLLVEYNIVWLTNIRDNIFLNSVCSAIMTNYMGCIFMRMICIQLVNKNLSAHYMNPSRRNHLSTSSTISKSWLNSLVLLICLTSQKKKKESTPIWKRNICLSEASGVWISLPSRHDT